MPAPAVIPAPRVYFKVVAFEKLVVYFEYNWERNLDDEENFLFSIQILISILKIFNIIIKFLTKFK